MTICETTIAGKTVYCHCAYAKAVPKKVKSDMLARLSAADGDFDAVPDLCEMSARKDPALASLAGSADLQVVACHTRAVKGLFLAAGHPLRDDMRLVNMRAEQSRANRQPDSNVELEGKEESAAEADSTPEEAPVEIVELQLRNAVTTPEDAPAPGTVLLYEGSGAQRMESAAKSQLLEALLSAGHPVRISRTAPGAGKTDYMAVIATGLAASERASLVGELPVLDPADLESGALGERLLELRTARELPKPGAWKPWFPVIDMERCTNCMQCLSFCLFDVYGVDEKGHIEVRNEEKCKTNCPACSRVCPEVAILFPKHAKGPINGDVVRKDDVSAEPMKVDISSLLGGDIYAALRNRNTDARKRFSTERDESKALLERKRCLKELQKDLDIPDEVLMSLPSVGDIEKRAERAKAKLAKRQSESRTVSDKAAIERRREQEWDI